MRTIIRKKVLAPAVVSAAVIALGVVGVNAVSAQDVTYPPIVQKLADKFNLNPADVQDAFNEISDERYADMMATLEQRLDTAVADGKITEDQKNAIIAKHNEIHEQMQSMKGLTPEERKQQMQKIRDDLKTWAQDNGITIDLGRFGLLGRGWARGFKAGYWAGSQ